MVYRAAIILIAFAIIQQLVRLLLRFEIINEAEAKTVFLGALAVAVIVIAWILPQRSDDHISMKRSSESSLIGNTNAF